MSCECKDHLDKMEGEIEVPVSAKKLFEYLFSDDQTGPTANGGVWNKMNTAKGNSGKYKSHGAMPKLEARCWICLAKSVLYV